MQRGTRTHTHTYTLLFVVFMFARKTVLFFQKSYREESRKEATCSLYAQMPQTIETVFATELTKTQSDVSPSPARASSRTVC